MSRKCNTKHRRNKGGYQRRLARRGLRSAPRMEDPKILEARQLRRREQGGHSWFTPGADAAETAEEVV